MYDKKTSQVFPLVRYQSGTSVSAWEYGFTFASLSIIYHNYDWKAKCNDFSSLHVEWIRGIPSPYHGICTFCINYSSCVIKCLSG